MQVTRQRQPVDGGGPVHAGNRFQPLDEPVVDLGHVLELWIFRPQGPHLERQDALGREPGIDRPQRLEAADHQPGADDKHEGERHLRYHQARAMPGTGTRHTAAAVTERDRDRVLIVDRVLIQEGRYFLLREA